MKVHSALQSAQQMLHIIRVCKWGGCACKIPPAVHAKNLGNQRVNDLVEGPDAQDNLHFKDDEEEEAGDFFTRLLAKSVSDLPDPWNGGKTGRYAGAADGEPSEGWVRAPVEFWDAELGRYVPDFIDIPPAMDPLRSSLPKAQQEKLSMGLKAAPPAVASKPGFQIGEQQAGLNPEAPEFRPQRREPQKALRSKAQANHKAWDAFGRQEAPPNREARAVNLLSAGVRGERPMKPMPMKVRGSWELEGEIFPAFGKDAVLEAQERQDAKESWPLKHKEPLSPGKDEDSQDASSACLDDEDAAGDMPKSETTALWQNSEVHHGPMLRRGKRQATDSRVEKADALSLSFKVYDQHVEEQEPTMRFETSWLLWPLPQREGLMVSFTGLSA
ncbi:hypothetical protein AK812_SmicGene16875 [Symbiodinium microadriaticum]|uniref:Uncharacterized protein n=1 Tax=Symbiodinium microadriaticum TaxID=2951 RepID=A0A1Q9DZ31_SYMMI|nr:hypothetical protein AK812_SmicGene16875 [Symbiodinium microadriaticum]